MQGSLLSSSDTVKNLWCLKRILWLTTPLRGIKRNWGHNESSIRILWGVQECPSICTLYGFPYSLVLTSSFFPSVTIMGHSWSLSGFSVSVIEFFFSPKLLFQDLLPGFCFFTYLNSLLWLLHEFEARFTGDYTPPPLCPLPGTTWALIVEEGKFQRP